MDCIQKAWYCTQCSLQFDSKDIYGLHKRLVHVQQILTKHIINEQNKKKSLQSEDEPLPKATPHKESQLLHNKEKTLKCESCEYSCSRKGHLTRHVASVHEGEKQFKCKYCGYSFSQKGRLTGHFESVHGRKKRFK